MARVEGTCEQCGKRFDYWPSQRRRFCSLACRGIEQASAVVRDGRPMPRKPRRGETTPCEVCGTPVYASRSARGKGQGRFCSYACHNEAQQRASQPKACAVCGAEMLLKPSQMHRQYCSKACEGVARTKRPLEEVYNGRPMRLDAQGYVMVWEPEHPNRSFKGWQYLHRLIVEKRIGRYLRSDEHVDHINRNKRDNRDENLQVLTQNDHARKSASEFRGDIEALRAEVDEYRRRFGPLT